MTTTETLDVLVAGGGPVGLVAALLCARAGLRVVVCEPRAGTLDKACGEGLMPAAVSALADLGVDPAGQALHGIRYVAPGRQASAEFEDGPGRGVQRITLQAELHRQIAAAGIEVITEAVGAVVGDADGVDVLTGPPGGSLRTARRARYVLAADGLHSPLRRQLGLDRGPGRVRRYGLRRHVAVAPWTDHVEVHWASRTEAYVTPVGPDCVNVAVLSTERGPLTTHLQAFPALLERLGSSDDHDHLFTDRTLGAGPLRQRSRRRVAGRVLLVGDASGYVDALTGEGISLGIAQAREAVTAITADRPDDYERQWRRVTWRASVFTHTLLAASRVPPIRRLIVPTAVAAPAVFRAAVNAAAHPAG